MVLGVLDQPQDERRNAHYRIRLYTLDSIPLKLRHTVAHAYDTGTQFPDSKEVSQTGHKPLVNGRHQLEHIPGLQSGAFERFLLVVSQSLKVLLRAAESHRIPHGTRCGDVIDHLILGDAKEILVEYLQVFLLRERDLHQILDMADLVDVYPAAGEHPLIIRRIRRQISQSIAQLLFLEVLYGFCRLKFNIFCHW